MAVIETPGNPGWPLIHEWSEDDKVEGGPDGDAVKPIKQLTERTEFLLEKMETYGELESGDLKERMSHLSLAIEALGDRLENFSAGCAVCGNKPGSTETLAIIDGYLWQLGVEGKPMSRKDFSLDIVDGELWYYSESGSESGSQSEAECPFEFDSETGDLYFILL